MRLYTLTQPNDIHTKMENLSIFAIAHEVEMLHSEEARLDELEVGQELVLDDSITILRTQ